MDTMCGSHSSQVQTAEGTKQGHPKTHSKELHMLLNFFHPTQTRLTWEEGSTIEELPSSERPVGKSMGTFARLTVDLGGHSPLWVVRTLGR